MQIPYLLQYKRLVPHIETTCYWWRKGKYIQISFFKKFQHFYVLPVVDIHFPFQEDGTGLILNEVMLENTNVLLRSKN